jgi:5'-nucleotidase
LVRLRRSVAALGHVRKSATSATSMTVLLTNDDGYRSQGLAAARAAMIEGGLRVLTVAPDVSRSGGSRAATFGGPVRIDRVGGNEMHPIFACDGTPVDCVRVALMSDLAPDVNLVVSGINEGANLGDDSTYSSTVGAAIEGALLGVGGVAISQQSRDRRFNLVDHAGYDWTSSALVAAEFARLGTETALPGRTVVSVNVPGHRPTAATQITRLGRRAYRRGGLEMARTEAGHGYFSFGVSGDSDPPIRQEAGTDFSALAAGRISLTPMSFEWGDRTSLDQAGAWAELAAARVDLRLFGSADAQLTPDKRQSGEIT